jgi:hypothetical protein
MHGEKNLPRSHAPLLPGQSRSLHLPKWFYDTSIGTTTRAAYCGALLEGLRLLYAQARKTRGFTWFGPPERNTLRPWEMLYCYVCVVLLKAEFNLSHPVAHPAFYSSRPWQLHCDAGPDRWL